MKKHLLFIPLLWAAALAAEEPAAVPDAAPAAETPAPPDAASPAPAGPLSPDDVIVEGTPIVPEAASQEPAAVEAPVAASTPSFTVEPSTEPLAIPAEASVPVSSTETASTPEPEAEPAAPVWSPPPPARSVAAEKAADLAEGAPIVDLTLRQLIQDVVYTNPAVEQARLEWLASLHATRAAWGTYEPDLVAEYMRSNTDRENSTLESLQQSFNPRFLEDRRDYKVALEGKIFSGAAYNVGYTLVKNNNNLTTNNEYQSFAGVSVQQPILKNAWYGSPWARVKVATLDRRIAFHGFRSRLMQTLYEAESAYWALSFAEEKHKAAGESVDIARKLVKDSGERVRSGVMSRLDLLEAEAGLATRLGALSDAREELLDAVNRLKLIMSDEKVDKRSWLRAATPLYAPAAEKPLPAVNEKFVEEVLRVQPGYLSRRYERDRAQAGVDYRRDQSLPEVNLKGSYGYSSLGVTRQQAWEKLKDRDHRAWTTGVELRVPFLLGVEERNLLSAEEFKRQGAEESLKAAEYEIASSLKTLHRRIESLRQRIQDAQKVVDFRKRLLDVELSRMRAGKSNTRVIFEAEEELSKAREFDLESRVRHREASLQFAVISGSLLADTGLEKVEDGRAIVGDPAVSPAR